MTNDLTRPIIGIENRTAQEVFNIMCDRIRRAPSPSPAPGVDISDPYMRIVMMFDRDETAGSFLSEDGEGGFAGAVYRMAREIDMLRAYIEGAPMQNPVRTLDLSNLLKHAFSAGYVSAAGDDGWTDYDPEQCAAYHRVSAALASLSQPAKGAEGGE